MSARPIHPSSQGSQQLDLILQGSTIVTDGLEFAADLGIASGKIVAIGDLAACDASSRLDCSGRLLMPGAVDLGVNLLAEGPHDPESQGSFFLSTRQAARGGVTTMITTLEVDEGDPFDEAIRAQRGADEAKACIDFSYHVSLNQWDPSHREQAGRAIAEGIPSFWLARTERTSRFPAPALLAAVLEDLPADALIITSTWDAALHGYYLDRTGNLPGVPWHTIFPEHLESSALAQIAPMVAAARAQVLLTGLSTASAVDALPDIRARAPRLHAACQLPHLYWSCEDQDCPKTWPPVRSGADQQALFQALDEGLLSVILSAHKPRPLPRQGQRREIGVSTLGHFYQVLHAEGTAKWRLTPGAISLAAAADPAKLAGLYPRKGTLQPGADADIVVINPNQSRAPKGDTDVLQGDLADPLSASTMPGAVEAVYLRGHAIFADDGTAGEMHGQFLPRKMALR